MYTERNISIHDQYRQRPVLDPLARAVYKLLGSLRGTRILTSTYTFCAADPSVIRVTRWWRRVVEQAEDALCTCMMTRVWDQNFCTWCSDLLPKRSDLSPQKIRSLARRESIFVCAPYSWSPLTATTFLVKMQIESYTARLCKNIGRAWVTQNTASPRPGYISSFFRLEQKRSTFLSQ